MCPLQVNNQDNNTNQTGFNNGMYIQYRLRINQKYDRYIMTIDSVINTYFLFSLKGLYDIPEITLLDK